MKHTMAHIWEKLSKVEKDELCAWVDDSFHNIHQGQLALMRIDVVLKAMTEIPIRDTYKSKSVTWVESWDTKWLPKNIESIYNKIAAAHKQLIET